MNLQQFINTYNNRYVDFDGAYGAQCADLFNQYTKDVALGNPYASTYMGAQEIGLNRLTFGGVYDILDPSIMGLAGDVVIWSGSFGAYLGGGYGHVAIMTENENPAGTVTVLTQNPGPATIQKLTTNGCIAYLRPKALHGSKPAVVKPVTGTNQRTVGSAGVNYRKTSTANGVLIETFVPGAILDFKGFVRGESVSGNNVWFVGAYTGGYAWSGGFTNSGTSGLSDLTPKAPVVSPAPKPTTPALTPTQRLVGSSGAKYRPQPNLSQTESMIYQPGDVLNFVGFVRGEAVNGNNIWLKGISGGYVWTGGLTSTSTAGLSDLGQFTPVTAPKPPVSTPPVVATPKPTVPPVKPTEPPVATVGDLSCVTEFIPAHADNYAVGDFPSAPTSIVVHQFGDKGIHIGSVLNYFGMSLEQRQKSDPNAGQSASHFVVEGDRIVQMVSLKNRAYHAGSGGNDFIGIETSPDQDEKTIASTNRLIKEINEKYGYSLTLMRHNEVRGSATACGTLIDLSKYKSTPVVGSGEIDIKKALSDLVLSIEKIIKNI